MSSSISSSLLDSSASSILGASTWNRQKDNQPVQGRPELGIGRLETGTNDDDDDDDVVDSGGHNDMTTTTTTTTTAGTSISSPSGRNATNFRKNGTDNEHRHLLQKRIYPSTIALVHPSDNDIESSSSSNNDNDKTQAFPSTFEKTELESAVLLDCLSNNFLFSHLSKEEIESSLLQDFEKVMVRKNEVIIRQGEPALYFYMLYLGDVCMQIDDGKDVVVSPLNENKNVDEAKETNGVFSEKYTVLGELALLTSSPHAATVKATSTTCTLFRLSRTRLQCALRPAESHLTTTTTTTTTANMEERVQTLKAAIPAELVEYLEDDEIALKKLASGMSTYSFRKGDVLYYYEKNHRTTKMEKAFVIVSQGLVVATDISLGGRTYEDMNIGPGESQTSFGWQSVVGEPMPAKKIFAATDGVALMITKQAFLNALDHGYHYHHHHHGGSNKSMKDLIEHLAAKRWARIQLRQITVFKDSELDDTQISGLLDLMHHCEYSQEETIFEARDKIEAAMYIVREGSVTLELDRGRTKQVIERGGYFGEKNMLLDQNKDGHKHFEIRASMTAIAHANSKIDVLYLEECRKVVNTTLLGLGKPATISAIDDSIVFGNLKRHALLGAGSYGQVWLASVRGKDDSADDTTTSQSDNKQILALKVQAKYRLVEADKAQQVIAERNVLASLHSPFIIRLFNSFQDETRLYMITSLLQGGELESLIPEEGLSENAAKFYAAGILEGLTYMHRRHIIHRDVKPENVLINSKGYPVLIDFGFAKYVPDKTYTFCGSPMFTAPEVIRYKGHDKACDYWSWAVVVYQLVTGKYPFYQKGMILLTLYKRICKGTFELDGVMSMEFRMLMVAMLYPDPIKRLGSRANGWRDIFASPWFSDDESFDLKQLRRQETPAPWVPNLKNPLDASRFHHDASEVDDLMGRRLPGVPDKQQRVFDSFGPMVASDSVLG